MRQGISFLLMAPIALLLGCTSLGTDGDDSGAPGAQTPFERDLAPKLAECLGCHGGSEPAAGLDLSNVQALAGIESGQLGMALVEPGNHLQSYLWHKVAGTQSIAGGMGRRMPVNHEWSDDDIDLLARWIDLGAPP